MRGGWIVRTIVHGTGARHIGLQNLACNIRRLVTLERLAAVKLKSLYSVTEAAGAERAVKTAIKLQTAPDLVPHHAAKSAIVPGALLSERVWRINEAPL